MLDSFELIAGGVEEADEVVVIEDVDFEVSDATIGLLLFSIIIGEAKEDAAATSFFFFFLLLTGSSKAAP